MKNKMLTPISDGRKRSRLSNGVQLIEPIYHRPDRPSMAPAACLRMLSIWLQRRRRRKTLAELVEHSDRLLDDIGVSRTEAMLEAAKPFWRS
jgi:uncharacterized protein YjiS (DUF1127 family)